LRAAARCAGHFSHHRDTPDFAASIPARRRRITALATGAALACVLAVTPTSWAPASSEATVGAAAHGEARRVALVLDAAIYETGGRVFTVPEGTQVTATVRLPTSARHASVLLQVARPTGWRTVVRGSSSGRGPVLLRVPAGSVGDRPVYRAVARTSRQADGVSPPVRVAVVSALRFPATATTPANVADLLGPSDSWTLLPPPGPTWRTARWAPCSPIRYRVHLAAGPPTPTYLADLTEAVRQVSAATGLTFVDQGMTDYQVDFDDKSQSGWPADTDLVIATSAEADTPQLAGGIVGWTQIDRWHQSGPSALIDHASIVFEQEWLATRGSDFEWWRGPAGGSLLLHELGHAVGLGHTDDPTQVMYPDLQGYPRYQRGDRTGLAFVGAHPGACPVSQP
jgi:hypothetical protein